MTAERSWWAWTRRGVSEQEEGGGFFVLQIEKVKDRVLVIQADPGIVDGSFSSFFGAAGS